MGGRTKSWCAGVVVLVIVGCTGTMSGGPITGSDAMVGDRDGATARPDTSTPGVDAGESFDAGASRLDSMVPPGEDAGTMMGLPAFATLFGGNHHDDPFGCVSDSSGDLFVTGVTRSADFPRTMAPGHSAGTNIDGFVSKMDADANVIWSRLLPGRDRDDALGIILDGAGNVYVVGTTSSTNFPTTSGAYDRTFNGGNYGDAFAMKLDPAGNIVYSTFLGGSEPDKSRAVLAVDGRGRLYVGGNTNSPDFPTTSGAYGCRAGPPECSVRVPHNSVTDAYLVRLSSDGSRLEASTLFGGTGEDTLWGQMIVMPDGSVLASGMTRSSNFPTTAGAYDRTLGGSQDAIIVRFSEDLDAIQFSTLLGGSGDDRASNKTALRLDSAGRMVLAGGTTSTDFPVTAGAYQSSHSSSDGTTDSFVAVLSADGSRLVRATYLGRPGKAEVSGTVITSSGDIAVAGQGDANDWPTTSGAFQSAYGGGMNDAWLTVLASDLGSIRYSTYLGGTGVHDGRFLWGDNLRCMTAHPSGAVAAFGYTSSADFPTTTGAAFSGVNDAFYVRIPTP